MRQSLMWLLSFSAPLYCQSFPSSGLVALYDMITVSSGALTDLSGNGHNATLHGTTQSTTGTTCNGSSDWIDPGPLLSGNVDFTVLMFIEATSGQYSGFAWSENDASADSSGSIGLAAGATSGGSISRIYGTGSGGTDWSGFNAPDYLSDWHMFFLSRSGATGIWGVLDTNYIVSRNLGNITALNTAYAAICARQTSGGEGNYNGGTIGYFAVYNRYLDPNDAVNGMAAAYNSGKSAMSGRGVYLPDLTTSVYPANVYKRQGTLINMSVGIANEKVLYTGTDCALISSPCFQMWGDTSLGVTYFEAPEATGPWTKYGTALLTSVGQCGVVKAPTNYYLLSCANSTGTGTQINIYKSMAINVPNSFNSTPIASGAITASGLGWTYVNNSSMLYVGSTLYLVWDGTLTSRGVCGGATSNNNGVSWTIVIAQATGLGDPEGCSGPDLHYFANNTFPWVIWGHGCQSLCAPALFRRQAKTFVSGWQKSGPSGFPATNEGLPALTNAAPDESNQMASFTHVEVAGICYGFYSSADASNRLHLKLVTANMSCASLAQSGEGAASDVP